MSESQYAIHTRRGAIVIVVNTHLQRIQCLARANAIVHDFYLNNWQLTG